MRAENVDERDSRWDTDEPRFRLFVFDGPGHAVTAHDLVDATIEDAMDAARALSGGDARLWSLALVVDDAGRGRGLHWLSGTDYNLMPTTAREWKLRRQMQDRYLQAKRRRGEPATLPNGCRVIRVFGEWVSGLPLWENFSDEYHLAPSSLPLSPSLVGALSAWNDEWQDRREDEPLPDPEGWRDRGMLLVERLREELGAAFEVRPEFLW